MAVCLEILMDLVVLEVASAIVLCYEGKVRRVRRLLLLLRGGEGSLSCRERVW